MVSMMAQASNSSRIINRKRGPQHGSQRESQVVKRANSRRRPEKRVRPSRIVELWATAQRRGDHMSAKTVTSRRQLLSLLGGAGVITGSSLLGGLTRAEG